MLTKVIKQYITRKKILSDLGFTSYLEYLNSDLWLNIRQKVFLSQGKACVSCKSKKHLQIHHTQYTLNNLKGKNIKNLLVLCSSCHEQVTKIERTLNTTAYKATKIFFKDRKVKKVEIKTNEKIVKHLKKNINQKYSIFGFNY